METTPQTQRFLTTFEEFYLISVKALQECTAVEVMDYIAITVDKAVHTEKTFGTLKRLESWGLVASRIARRKVGNANRCARVYEITVQGEQNLQYMEKTRQDLWKRT